tara:strand:+ start:40 stop:222 length:183 start_codon:yes stop_codon:yes gene_type:complete
MEIEKENAKFKCYCQLMYSENCTERMDHGQTPYPSLDAYVTKNYDFIVNKYKGGLEPWIL